ncbi:MAG: AtpZ/AtpI family protein [Polyangia bacterium]|jgi:F0F1-type ATP synthase assembly protein I
MDPESKKMWAIAGSTGAVGLEISLAIGIGYFGGRYLDGKLGTAPWLAWVGFAAGVGAGIKALIRVARDYQKSLDNDQDNEPKQP